MLIGESGWKNSKHSISLRKYKEIICLKEKKSAVDKLFLENADEFMEKMQHAHRLLKGSGYLDKVRLAMSCNQITHGEFKKHAILEGEPEGVFITNFEQCSYDICEFDIATLFESFSGRNKGELAAAAVESYTSVKPLDYFSLNIIKAFLMWPRRFFKVAESAYGRMKNYNEIELRQKLERSIKREKKKEELIRFLDSGR